MRYRIDKKNGNKISALGFGCMRLPKTITGFDVKKSEALIMRAYEGGVNYYDTARLYAGNEETLGVILKRNKIRKNIFLASKLPTMMIPTANDINKHFNITLEKLQTDYIDYYLMHTLSDLAGWQKLLDFGIAKWIEEKKKVGIIRHIGFSFHGVLEEYLKILDSYDWDASLIQYNYSNENYQAGVKGLKAAAAKGIPVFIMEPLLGGKLVNNLPKGVHNVFKEARPEWSPARWGLNWLWNQSEVTMVLSGMNEMSQLEDNIAAADASDIGMLGENEAAAYIKARDIFNESYKIKCTGCGYCMPCPRNVNIPGCFSSYNTSYAIGFLAALRQYGHDTTFTAKQRRNAGQCIKCGKCEKHCPQHLPIRENLSLVRSRMEPLWYRVGMAIIRKFMSF